MSAATWVIARGTLNCQRCHELIIEGEWLKLVTVSKWPWCTACVKAVIRLNPPDDELKPVTLSPAGVPSNALDLSRFKPNAVEGAQNFLPLLERLKYRNHRHK
jgi:hypothetical protein